MSKDPHSTMNISLPHSLRMAFAKRCRRDGTPMSAILAGLIRNYLNPKETDDEPARAVPHRGQVRQDDGSPRQPA